MANPGVAPASVRLTWQTPGGPVGGPEATVAPLSRLTFRANDSITATSLATVVEASAPVVAERSIYVTSGPLAPAATAAPGLTGPASTFTFPEGSTLPGFEEYLLVQNPAAQAAAVTVTFLRAGGPDPSPVSFPVAAGGRFTLRVNDVRPGVAELGAVLSADRPVLAERAMYYRTPSVVDGTAVTGVPGLSRRWLLAEGSTGPGFDEWVLVANPGTTPVTSSLTLVTPSGPAVGPRVNVAAGGRSSVHLNDFLTDWSVSVVVDASGPVAVERTLFVSAPDKSGVTGSEGLPDR